MYVVKDTWTSKMSGKISNCKVPWSSARRSLWSPFSSLAVLHTSSQNTSTSTLAMVDHQKVNQMSSWYIAPTKDIIPCSLHHFYHSFSQHFIPNYVFIWFWCLTTHVKKYNIISTSIRKCCSMIGKFHWGVCFLFREHSLMIGMKYTGLTSQFDSWNSY